MKYLPFVLLFALTARSQELSLADAIAMALAKNGDVVVERESLHIAEATVLRAEAAYEPTLRGELRLRERTDPVNSILSGAPRGELAPTQRSFVTSASVVQLLPTGGTVSVFSGITRDDTNSILALLTPSWTTLLGAEVRQPLLQNRRIDPARRAIRIAHVDRTRAISSLRRVATETTAAVERAYWTAVAAQRDVETRQSALEVAEKQREDTRTRIEAGTQSEADLAQTTAEVERRRGELVVARENAERAGNALAFLTGASGFRLPGLVAATETPRRPPPDAAIATAIAHRADLDELTTRLERADIDIEAAADRVRPQIDLVAHYSGRGLAGTRNEDAIEPFGPVVVANEINGGLGRSFRSLDEFPDASLGVAISIPIGNTAAKQDVAIARALRRQSEATLEHARQRIAMEVRNAIASLASAEQRITAARAAREAAEVQLQAERDRFEAGISNTFFILTRQNDLTAARVAETVALADYRKAETEFARATGTLLEARGISIEGGTQ
ncbi:MAG TPA: TolC family protein [Thermoanaerobaculia bacterium]|nr:TolC family protein [Thermoanaerobaculia bacterium]